MSIKKTNQEIKSEEMKLHITQTAKKLFSEYGLKKVSVRDIAEHAGVTTGTLYYYFKNKDDILDAAYHNDSAGFEQKLMDRLEVSEDENLILYFFGTIMVEQVLNDGKEFTRHRIYNQRKQWDKDSDFYRIVCEVVQKCRDRDLLGDDLTIEEMADFLLLVYRATTSEWARREDEYDLKENMIWNMKLAIRSISK